MKKMVLVLSVLIVCLFLTACAVPLTALMALNSAVLVGSTLNLHEQLVSADSKITVKGKYNAAWQASNIALKSLDIQIEDVKENNEKDGGVIIGKTSKHTIKVVVVKLTETTTDIGVWASRSGKMIADHHFAGLITTEIQKNTESSKSKI